MRLVEYIQNKRGYNITKEEADELIATKHKKAYKSNSYIYRGVYDYGDYAYIEPEKSKQLRISANTSNYYTLILDNSGNWKKYPKRSKSLICSTSYKTAEMFSERGSVYRVLPENDSNIGICPKNDIWGTEIKYKGKEYLFDRIVDFIGGILNIIGSKNDREFSIFLKDCLEVDNKKEYINGFVHESRFGDDIIELWKFYLESDYGFYGFVNMLYEPNKCGFELEKIGSYIPENREVWTSSPCVLIRLDV